MKIERELMRGAGPTAVLQLLSSDEKYGYELVEALSRQTDGVLAMGQSTLYPMLYNLEAKKLVKSRVDKTGPRPRRYYRLTRKGERKLATDTRQWQAVIEAMRSLGVAPQGAATGGA
ncbi:MAG: PadR family transcriptional regulator [Planctomycetes bacterium]|nr:PadR family transcriptional regulator [Planctomycetota bacterium]